MKFGTEIYWSQKMNCNDSGVSPTFVYCHPQVRFYTSGILDDEKVYDMIPQTTMTKFPLSSAVL